MSVPRIVVISHKFSRCCNSIWTYRARVLQKGRHGLVQHQIDVHLEIVYSVFLFFKDVLTVYFLHCFNTNFSKDYLIWWAAGFCKLLSLYVSLLWLFSLTKGIRFRIRKWSQLRGETIAVSQCEDVKYVSWTWYMSHRRSRKVEVRLLS